MLQPFIQTIHETLHYSEFTDEYVQDICDALNEAGARMDKETNKLFAPEYFTTLTQFLQNYILQSLQLYTFLNDNGLVNRGRCPYTGQRIDESFPNWSFMGNRKIYVSHEGYAIMQKEDDEEYERVMGRPKVKKNATSSSSGGCYIATVCYGNESAPEVLALKWYRDNVLQKNIFGKIFIKVYYLTSPSIARKMKSQVKANAFIRKYFLNKLVNKISKL